MRIQKGIKYAEDKELRKGRKLEQAYELNQKRTACVLGGMVWLKMGNRNIMTAIDLSGLGLDIITETEEAFVIGCMTPLHALETHKELNAYTNSAIRESVRHIVVCSFETVPQWAEVFSEDSDFPMY